MSQRTIFKCDGEQGGKPCAVEVQAVTRPTDWHELCSMGFIIGEYCPGCSLSVNIPRALELAKRRAHPPAA